MLVKIGRRAIRWEEVIQIEPVTIEGGPGFRIQLPETNYFLAEHMFPMDYQELKKIVDAVPRIQFEIHKLY